MVIEPTCNMPTAPDYTGVTIIELAPEPALNAYLQAMELANDEAEKKIARICYSHGTTETVILSRRNMPVNAM